MDLLSNSRAFRRRVQRSLAADDGRTLHVPDACCDLVLTVSPTAIAARHDDHCPALRPDTPGGFRARLRAERAITSALTDSGYGQAIAVLTQTPRLPGAKRP